MPQFRALLRRHETLLFLCCIALLAAVAIVQTLRLQYLEARHAEMFSSFGKAQLDFQMKAGELQGRLAACNKAAPARP